MVNELQAVVKELGGRNVLGATCRPSRSAPGDPRRLSSGRGRRIAAGSPALRSKNWQTRLDLSPRSLQRRRRSGRLARFESDRLYRLARIVALAQQSLGDRETGDPMAEALQSRSRRSRAHRSHRHRTGIAPSGERARPHRLRRNQLIQGLSGAAQGLRARSFDGEGAYRYGGRWSSPGTRLTYTSEHQSLAMLEYFVHLDADDAPPDLVLVTAEIPDDLPDNRSTADELPRIGAALLPRPNSRASETSSCRKPSAPS